MLGKEHQGQNRIGDEQPPCGWASTIRVKFQIVATNVLELIELTCHTLIFTAVLAQFFKVFIEFLPCRETAKKLVPKVDI
jgi:hypothetical protein